MNTPIEISYLPIGHCRNGPIKIGKVAIEIVQGAIGIPRASGSHEHHSRYHEGANPERQRPHSGREGRNRPVGTPTLDEGAIESVNVAGDQTAFARHSEQGPEPAPAALSGRYPSLKAISAQAQKPY